MLCSRFRTGYKSTKLCRSTLQATHTRILEMLKTFVNSSYGHRLGSLKETQGEHIKKKLGMFEEELLMRTPVNIFWNIVRYAKMESEIGLGVQNVTCLITIYRVAGIFVFLFLFLHIFYGIDGLIDLPMHVCSFNLNNFHSRCIFRL